MAGNIPKVQYPTLHYQTRAADGTEIGWGIIQGGAGEYALICIARWSWDELFTQQFYFPMYGDGYSLTAGILQALGIWDKNWPAGSNNPTWDQLYNGASITDAQGTFVGLNAMAKLFSDYCATDTSYGVEQATKLWVQNTILPKMQQLMDATINVTVAPPAPPPPVPGTTQFPPQQVDGIASAAGAWIATNTLLVSAVDPSNPLRMVISEGAIPA